MSDPAIPESFAELLRTLNGGQFNSEVTDALQELVRQITRVAEHGGGKPKGKLNVAITFQLDRGIMSVDPDVKVTTPSVIRMRSIMYAMPDGRLVKNDPRQLEAFHESRDVSTPDVRDIRTRQAGER